MNDPAALPLVPSTAPAFEPIERIESRAFALPLPNVDTDQILPARYLQKPRSDDFGQYLFKDRRSDVGYAPPAGIDEGPRILVAGRNFGCGSSREHAVWALIDAGFRAIIAPSIGDIFSGNARKNGLLTITLPESTVQALLVDAARGAVFGIDLEAQTVKAPSGPHTFAIDPFSKRCLRAGLDELAYTLQLLPQIVAFESRETST